MLLCRECNPAFYHVFVFLYFSFLLGLMKCPGGPQCPACASPNSLKNHGLLEQTTLTCILPVIPSAGRGMPLEAEVSEIHSIESFIEPLGSASLDLSDHQGNSLDLKCNITQPFEIQDNPLPDLTMALSAPLPLALSLMLDCPVDRQGYEKLWRILAYYSETAVHLERQTILRKALSLAYHYRQAAETDGYYHSGVRVSVKAKPEWLLQPAISIQLNRAHSNGHKVQLIYSTRVSAHLDLTSSPNSLPYSKPWVLILTNTTTAFAAAAGHKVELPCPLLSSGNPKVHWILPDGSQHFPTYNSSDSRLQISTFSLVLPKVRLSDAGIYYCIAQVDRDVDVLPLRLAVEESSVPPSREPVGLSITSVVGEPVILSCKASGSPEPQTSWLLPDGKIVSQGVTASGGVTLYPNGSLLLPNPSRKDAGYYRCIAVSQYGSDALSTQLELNTKHRPLLKIPFPRGPQSAAGRSTKIRAPLLREVGEGSGVEEEKEDQTLSSIKGHPRPGQPLLNRRYPAGNPRRRGPVRGSLRKGPLSSTDQRRNHLQNRFRVNANKKRIDPQKWADLLAKIRQKTEHTSKNPTNRAEKPQTEEVTGSSGNTHNDTQGEGVIEAVMESETEGSSADVSDLQEEGLQPIYPVVTETKTHSKAKTDAGTDSEIKNGVVMSTAMLTDIDNSRETHIQKENVGPQTEIVTNPDNRKEVMSQTISATNTIIPKPNERGEQKSNPTIEPYKNQQSLLHRLVPNSRPQSPWNSRRRFGHRRRIMHRPSLRPLNPLQTHPHRSNPKSPTETSEPPTEQTNWLLLPSTTSSPTSLFPENIHRGNAVEQNSFNPPFSHTPSVSTSKSDSPLVTSSPSSRTSLSPTHADMVTLRTEIPEPAGFTQAPSRSDNTTAVTDVFETSAKTHKHGLQTDTETQTVSGTHREKLERNSLNAAFVSHSSTISPSISSSTVPISSTTMAATEKITAPITTQNSPLSSTSIAEMLWMTTSTPVTSRPILSTIAVVKKTVFNTSRKPTSTVPTAAPTTPSLPSTAVTQSTPDMRTSAVTKSHTFTLTTAPIPTTVLTPMKPESAALSTSKISTRMGDTTSAPSTSITTPIKTSSAVRIVVDQGGRPVSGVSNQSLFSTDWKNPGVNSIPDSHSSRPRRPPSPLLPAAPGVSPTKFKCIIMYCF